MRTVPSAPGTKGSFLRVRVLYKRRAMAAPRGRHGDGRIKALAPTSRAIPRDPNRAGSETYFHRGPLTRPAGPIDQRKIAAFARRKPWVQIPLGPLPRIRGTGTRLKSSNTRGPRPRGPRTTQDPGKARPLWQQAGENASPYSSDLSRTMFFTRGARSGASSSRYVMYPEPTLK